MKTIPIAILSFLFFSILLIGNESFTKQNIQNFSCSSKNTEIIKKGTYVAINIKYFEKMQNAIRNKDINTLKKMLQEKVVIKINRITKICVIQREFAWYRAKVKIEGFNDFDYWVDDRKIENLN